MAKKKGPKTAKGKFNRDLTGDGRMNLTTAIDRSLGINKKKGKK